MPGKHPCEGCRYLDEESGFCMAPYCVEDPDLEEWLRSEQSGIF